ncbi:conserved hypothetical protein [Paecilomyces variotii No. 5]|uniref:Xylanolytic transcriptional activator regulatory domain-containing protein n=1 Tax=Byssochlamys spectabilis (strain No. 5 / NBRC 109023) TaxID=1356009 RepID=V5G600_BYSSN|nr:conserved hypothetical protein [Paecilomyces variotii No. 5]
MHAASWISKRHRRQDQLEDADNRPRKRRARYALRACDEFCTPSSPRRVVSEVADGERTHVRPVSEIERLSSQVESMRTQIDALVRLGKPVDDEHGPSSRHAACEDQDCVSKHARPVTSQIIAPSSPCLPGVDPGKCSDTRYCGASSSDYSLNVAEICIQPTQRQGPFEDLGSPPKRPPYLIAERPNIGECECFTPGESSRVQKARFSIDCTRSLRMIDVETALQLANEYQDVVGGLYPILDVEHLVSQIRAIYTALDLKRPPEDTGPQIDSEDINILKVVLAVALRTRTIARNDVETALFASVQKNLCCAFTSQVHSSRTVTLLLLVSIYHFFRGELQVAWRTCGIAGRMAMELGLHRRDARLHLTEAGKGHGEFINILWTIVVLDRQWSCETGLPFNFEDKDFAKSLPEPVEIWALSPIIAVMLLPVPTAVAGGHMYQTLVAGPKIRSLNGDFNDQYTAETRAFETRRVRSPLMTADVGISDAFDDGAVSTMLHNIPQQVVTDAELNVLGGLESSLDGQTWEELSVLFSQNPL